MKADSSSVRAFAFRLRPKADLKKSIIEFALENGIKAGAILTCVGSLEKINLRFANQVNGELRSGFFEIVSLTGTFTASGGHLHISISDSGGRTLGGHLLDGNIIYTTAEIVITELTDFEFGREPDSTYGYHELTVTSKSKQ